MDKLAILSRYPYRIELHAHTKPASPCSEIPPEEAVQRYHALGCHAMAITNHFNLLIWKKDHDKQEVLQRYYSDYLRAKAEGDRLGMQVYFGLEIRFSEAANDYLVYGVDASILSPAYDTLDEGLADFVSRCHSREMFVAQAHPFRDGMVRADPALLDGVEVYNMHYNHNSRVALAARFAAEHGKTILGGTDFHHPGQEGLCFLRAATLPKDSFALADLLRSGDYVFEMGDGLIIP